MISSASIEKKRKSSIEALRIISMLIIIGYHALYHGCSEDLVFGTDLKTLLLQGFSAFGNLGNYIFVYISSWFLVDAKYSNKKLFNIWSQMFFYSVAVFLIVFIFKINKIAGIDYCFPSLSLKSIVSFCFPFLTGKYWFASCYLLFYCFTPYFSILVKNLNEEMHRKLVLLLVSLVLILRLIPFQNIYWLIGGNLMIFVTIYFFATYIKRYFNKSFIQNKSVYLIFSLLCICFIILWRIGITYYFGLKIDNNLNIPEKAGAILNLFTSMYAPTNIFITYFLFEFFDRCNLDSKYINKLGSSVFGIYLIHEHPFIRHILWNKIFHMEQLVLLPYFPLLYIGIVLVVFLSCCFIDLFRQHLFKNFERFITR